MNTEPSPGRFSRIPASIMLLITALAIGSGIGIGAGIWAGSSTGPIIGVSSLPSDLYVVDAATAFASKIDATKWRLNFTNVEPVLWFSDTPQRASGTFSAAELTQVWPKLFTVSNPNGALMTSIGLGGHYPTAVTLSHPRWDANTTTFSVLINPAQY